MRVLPLKRRSCPALYQRRIPVCGFHDTGNEDSDVFRQLFEDDEEEEPGRFEKFLDRVFGEKLESVIMSIVMVLSFILAIGIFMILPTCNSQLFQVIYHIGACDGCPWRV